MDQQITLRRAILADAGLLAALGRETFSDNFGAMNTPENMADYLAASFNPEIQGEELADLRITYLIAEVRQAAVGFVKLMASVVDPSVRGPDPYELVRIYARTGWIGRGVGSALMKASLEEAARLAYHTLWLGVWEQNLRARAFYLKWGFTESGTHLFWLSQEAQTDIVMERPVVLPASIGN